MIAESHSVSEALRKKFTSVNSMLLILQRTLDSQDSCVYIGEARTVLDDAIEKMTECEELIEIISGEG